MSTQDGKYFLIYSAGDTLYEFPRSDEGLDSLALCLNLCPPTVVLCAGEISQDEVSRLLDRCFEFNCFKVEHRLARSENVRRFSYLKSLRKQKLGRTFITWELISTTSSREHKTDSVRWSGIGSDH